MGCQRRHLAGANPEGGSTISSQGDSIVSEKAAAKIIISGRVQGVGFRYFTTSLAKSYQVAGWVRNLATGDVEVQVEGDKGPVMGFLKDLKIGTKFSEIGNFQIEWMNYQGKYENFSVRY